MTENNLESTTGALDRMYPGSQSATIESASESIVDQQETQNNTNTLQNDLVDDISSAEATDSAEETDSTPAEAAQESNENDDLINDILGESTATEDAPTHTPPAFDPTPYASLLGKEIKSQDDLVAELKSLKANEAKYNEMQASLDSLPAELKELNDIARSGGDWQELINHATLDLNKIPVTDFLRGHLLDTGRFPDTPEGMQEMNEWLEAQDPTMVELLAGQHKEAAIKNQQAFLQERKLKAINEKQGKDLALRSTLDNVKSFAGIEVTPSKREAAYDKLSKGQFIINGKDGKPDFEQSVKALLFWENRKDIVEKLTSKKAVESTKKVLANASNVNVSKNSQPLPLTESKQKSALDRLYGG